jgi:PIN domain nuclease of toxin-antitoxin system
VRDYILDTHAFLWFLSGDKQLSKKAKLLIEDTSKSKYISIASIWEISIKLNLKKLNLGISLEDLKDEITINGFEILPLDFDHIIELSRLENHHKDPFDRILIAQAISENLQIVSIDQNFNLYKDLKVVW